MTSSERYCRDPSLKTISCSACRSLFNISWHGVQRYSAIFEGRKNGCGLCVFLLEAIQHFKVANEPSTSLDSISLVDWTFMEVQHEAYEERKTIDIYAPLGRIGSRLHFTLSCPSLDLLFGRSNTILGRPIPFHEIIELRDISIDPLSDLSLALVQNWINTCTDSHPFCRSASSDIMPKRLIYLGEYGTENPRLVFPMQGFRYFALSHCWGGSNPSITTKSNVASRHLGIPSSQIPRTFQDAIKVTRWLNFQYLWIDTLCVVQNDKEDWDTESSKMADIYSGAWMVIAASRAQDSDAGFLGLREGHRHLTLTSSTHASFPVHVRRNIDHNTSWSSDIPDQLIGDRLADRAWCFQERLLPPRVLFFGEREL